MEKRIGKEQHGCFSRPSLGVVSLWVALSAALVPLSALAQARPANPPGGAPKPTAQDKHDAEVDGMLVACWQAFYSGKYEEAATQAEALAKLGARYKYVMIEAQHLCARANLAAGTKQSVAKALQIWKALEKDTSTANKTRIQIAKSLQLESQAQAAGVKPDVAAQRIKAAIDTLESLLKDRRWNSQEVEAALVLANLYSNRSAARFDDARKMLDYVVSYLGDANNIQRMELSPELAKTYIEAAQSALSKLKYSEQLGLTEFEAAEHLRRDKKFTEAQKAYLQITKDFPRSDFAPRSEYAIGLCLLAGQGSKQAIEHWQKFIASAPAGPWRGQSYVDVIDCCLAEFDLVNAAKYATLARSNLSDALSDERSNLSWEPAQFDIVMRAGIVNYCQGNARVAAEAFTEAQVCAPSQEIADNIEPLVLAARAGKSVIPDDVKGSGAGTSERRTAGASVSPRERVALALSIGVIHLATGQLDNAQAMFDRVLGIPAIPAKAGTPGQPAKPAMQGVTPVQLAFATFGKGAVLQARGDKFEETKTLFAASIKAFDAGSWHYESYYRISIIAQEELAAKFGKSGVAKAESDLAARFKAQQEILGYRQELLKRYPESPRAEYTAYTIGLVQYQMAQLAPANRAEQIFKDAALSLNRFQKNWPQSRWAGSAISLQASIALERLFDLDSAKALIASGENWATRVAAQLANDDEGKEEFNQPLWMLRDRQPSTVRADLYQIYLQSGLVAYLGQHYDRAIKAFEAALPFTPERDFVVVDGDIPTGIESIIMAAREKRTLTPKEALDGDAKVRLILQLGDIYLVAESFEKSLELATMVTGDLKKLASAPQRSWGHRLAAVSLGDDLTVPEDAQEEVLQKKLNAKSEFLLAQQTCPTAPWAGDCLFWAGTIAHNYAKDKAEALNLFEKVVRQYPTGEFASKSAYFVGVIYEWGEQWPKAKTAYQRVIRDYPESRWATAAMNYHMKVVDAALEKTSTSKPKEK